MIDSAYRKFCQEKNSLSSQIAEEGKNLLLISTVSPFVAGAYLGFLFVAGPKNYYVEASSSRRMPSISRLEDGTMVSTPKPSLISSERKSMDLMDLLNLNLFSIPGGAGLGVYLNHKLHERLEIAQETFFEYMASPAVNHAVDLVEKLVN
ncbi:MAG: hypothetical protein WDZ77_01180 [Candidatus Pacearchaeota archaeon]